jgi:hypothetical protein
MRFTAWFLFAIAVASLPAVALAQTGLPAVASAEAGLDFQIYRTRVEPLFAKPRGPLNGPCFVCHTRVTSRLRLQPLSPGAASWTEDQSRRNFESVSRVVSPGDPVQSQLLLRPLAVDAGGSPIHPGGKVWASRDDAEWKIVAEWIRAASRPDRVAAPQRALDFETFRTRVQPILLDKRTGLARCYVCHSQGTPFRLQALSSGSASWNDEESRRNFEAIQRLVVPGDPVSSRLLMMPLATEAGGDPFHPGGKRWTSRDDPEWQMLAKWVNGQ